MERRCAEGCDIFKAQRRLYHLRAFGWRLKRRHLLNSSVSLFVPRHEFRFSETIVAKMMIITKLAYFLCASSISFQFILTLGLNCWYHNDTSSLVLSGYIQTHCSDNHRIRYEDLMEQSTHIITNQLARHVRQSVGTDRISNRSMNRH